MGVGVLRRNPFLLLSLARMGLILDGLISHGSWRNGNNGEEGAALQIVNCS